MACSGPKRSAVDGLPEDSLVEILARVPTRSVYRSKCVAKGWRDLIEDPLHGKKLPQTLRGFFSIDIQIYGCGCRGSGGGHVGFTSLRASSAPLGIDSRLSFVTELPETKTLTLVDSCNGLLLFEHGLETGPSDRLGYIVCNPATKHWVSVPRHGSVPRYARGEERYTYLVFDPVVSSDFHIVQFWYESARVVSVEDLIDNYINRPRRDHDDDEDDDDEEKEVDEGEVELSKDVDRISVHVYSSETGTWSHIKNEFDEELGELEGWRHQGVHVFSSETGTWSHIQNEFDEFEEEPEESKGVRCQRLFPHEGPGCAVHNGMLHFIISGEGEDEDQIVAVDVQGETQRIIPLPARAVRKPGYVAQSQGRLHYIDPSPDAQLSIWVLEDTQKWVLKHNISFVELFGKRKRSGYNNEYEVVAMHPDGNVVFIVQNQKLISYDMDHKLKNVIATSEDNISADHIVPYVPCFVESPALTNKN